MMEHEAAAFGSRTRLDGADEEHVVAGEMPVVVPTLERRHTAFDQWRSCCSEPVDDTAEMIDVRP